MRVFDYQPPSHKRVQEIKFEHWRACIHRIRDAMEIEMDKLQSGVLDDYPQERAHTEGRIEAYEEALDAIEAKIENTDTIEWRMDGP